MVETGDRIDSLVAERVKRVPRMGSFEFPADLKIRWAFEAGLPDPATFPLADLERLTTAVLEDDAADALQYGSPGSNGIGWGYEGLRDRIAERTERLEGRAKGADARVEWHEGGHEIRENEIEAARLFLEAAQLTGAK